MDTNDAPVHVLKPAISHPIPNRLNTRKSMQNYTAFVLIGEDVVLRPFRGDGLNEAVVLAGVGDDTDQVVFLFDGQEPENMMLRQVGPGGRAPTKTRLYTVLARRDDEFGIHFVRFGGGVDEFSPLEAEGWKPFFATINHYHDLRNVTRVPRIRPVTSCDMSNPVGPTA